MILSSGTPTVGEESKSPQVEISSSALQASLGLPDAQKGFYRGTRFDWSGVIRALTHEGHHYYGPWFNKTDPQVIDFVFSGEDIVAGPCSAITGPVEEFTTRGKALGFDQAQPGATFIKIGVGVLRRPDAQDYNPYRLYEIVDGGKWNVETKADSVVFSQEVNDAASGYAYRYTKTIRLAKSKPEMTIEHKLENLGKRVIESSVYDHNFLVLDNEPVGPDYSITLPFDMSARHSENAQLAEIHGRQFTYRKILAGHETVSADLAGFGSTAADYHFVIENRKARAGMRIVGDRPLSRLNLWSIRTVVALEPFIDMSIKPGDSFSWTYTYTYYSL